GAAGPRVRVGTLAYGLTPPRGAGSGSSIAPMRGVVAGGHPLTAEAGARVLREGGNAVDAAVAAAFMSFAAESPLTGPGAGGFMLVHTADGEDHPLDLFAPAPGRGPHPPETARPRPPQGGRTDAAAPRLPPGAASRRASH